MTKQSTQVGFTLPEIIVVGILFLVAAVIFAWQWNDLQISFRDDQRKVAINAIYYGLEESFKPASGYYPEQIDDDTIKTVDPSLLTDPNGNKLGASDSDYRYEPTGCNDGRCTGYSLRALLENEADFTKKNR
ncbi:type II secretion system protein [Candidatus Saccharibacteria bacterium]|nr:type II secretion system protein [Candidatus Saccharibacteria bacterium]